MAPPGNLQGKVALVSGGAGGIGSEVCLRLASEGASVVVVDLVSADQLTSKIVDAGGRANSVQADLAKTADVVAAFDKAVEAFGAVHIVVNLAAIGVNSPTFQTTTNEDWDRIFFINCKGSFLVAREAAKRLGLGGRIVMTSPFLSPSPGRAPDDLSSIVLVDKDRSYVKSEAILQIGQCLKFPYPPAAFLGFIFPMFFQDAVYDTVANNRYSIYGMTASCRLSDPRFADRFIE